MEKRNLIFAGLGLLVIGLLAWVYRYHRTWLGLEPKSPNFSFEEFFTRDAQYNRFPPPKKYWGNIQKVMNTLEVIRAELGGEPLSISSGYRSEWHNKAVGGVPNSYHKKGMAADITSNVTPAKVQSVVEKLMKSGRITPGGLGRGATFTHVDIKGSYRTWGYNDGRSFNPNWDI